MPHATEGAYWIRLAHGDTVTHDIGPFPECLTLSGYQLLDADCDTILEFQNYDDLWYIDSGAYDKFAIGRDYKRGYSAVNIWFAPKADSVLIQKSTLTTIIDLAVKTSEQLHRDAYKNGLVVDADKAKQARKALLDIWAANAALVAEDG